jgi:hypothetical protein
MALLFCDSFDTYTNLSSKWDSTFNGYITVLGHARTGVGCVEIDSGYYGPGKTVKATQDILVAGAWQHGGPGGVMTVGNAGGASKDTNCCVSVELQSDGSLVANGTGPEPNFSVSTASGVVRFGVYNHIALRAFIAAAPNGRVRIWVNGVLALDAMGLDTRNRWQQPGSLFANAFALNGSGGSAYTTYIDDVYCLDCTVAPNNAFLGPIRIYAAVPNADGVVQWAPSIGGSNFANVDSIPPNENTEYNSSATVGQADQYSHPLPGGVPSNSQLFGLQHSQDLEVDTGARSVTSDIAGALNGSAVALPSGYQIFSWPYDVDPVTGLSWVAADFPLLAGPAVTA